MPKISSLQKKFVYFYLYYLDPLKAAILAGYNKKNALSQAQSLLDNPLIIQEMNRLLKSQVTSLNVQKAYVVKKLLDIIESSLADDFQDPSDKQHSDNSLIASVSSSSSKSEGNTTKNPKDLSLALKAIEHLCKQLNYPSQDLDHPSLTLPFNSFSSNDINIIDNLDQQKI